VHRHRQPRARAVTVERPSGSRAPPLGDAGGEHPGRGQIAPSPRLVEAVDILGLPEVALEPVILPADAPHLRPVAGDDRPGPDRGEQQQHHHDLHGQIGVQEEPDQPHQAVLA
jgi:hypothetical protein